MLAGQIGSLFLDKLKKAFNFLTGNDYNGAHTSFSVSGQDIANLSNIGVCLPEDIFPLFCNLIQGFHLLTSAFFSCGLMKVPKGHVQSILRDVGQPGATHQVKTSVYNKDHVESSLRLILTMLTLKVGNLQVFVTRPLNELI